MIKKGSNKKGDKETIFDGSIYYIMTSTDVLACQMIPSRVAIWDRGIRNWYEELSYLQEKDPFCDAKPHKYDEVVLGRIR